MNTGNLRKGVDYPGVSIVFFCHDGAGNFLLQKRSTNARDEHGRWDCGAGGLDLHETVEGTLKREILEEYGVEPLSYEFLGFRDLHREHNGEKTHWATLDFRVLVDPAKARNGEPHKFEEIGWFKLDTLPNPLHSQLPRFLEKYKHRL